MSSRPGCDCSICDAEHAESTPSESDPHSYYCAECRATFDFHHTPGCTCRRVQKFVVAHRESHDAETKRIQVKASVNIRSAEKLGLVDDARESAGQLRVDLPQDSLPIDQTCKELRTRIANLQSEPTFNNEILSP